jgi:hypothetical protein
VTNTVTLIADHKGIAKPFVVGHQYVSLASVAVSSYRTGSPATAASQTITAADANPDTLTRNAGSYLTDGFAAGDYVTVLGSHADNNAKVFEIATLTATVLTTSEPTVLNAGGAGVGGGDEQVLHVGEKLLAADFGLASLTQVEVSNPSLLDANWIVGDISSDGTYCYLYCFTLGSAANTAGVKALADDLGTLRVRATGLL